MTKNFTTEDTGPPLNPEADHTEEHVGMLGTVSQAAATPRRVLRAFVAP